MDTAARVLQKPCRAGLSGTKPFGSTGLRADAGLYEDHFRGLVDNVKFQLRNAVPAETLECAESFTSPALHHRHRGCFSIVPSSSGFDYAHWDSQAKAYSLVGTSDVENLSIPIITAMRFLQQLPIAPYGPTENVVLDELRWQPLGAGLRSVQLHSTLSGELLICFVYHDPLLKNVKRAASAGTGTDRQAWRSAAQCLRDSLLEAHGDAVHAVDVMGRWKRQAISVQRGFVREKFPLRDGRILQYKQPEGQFSNPNAPCEIECLEWLCQMGREVSQRLRASSRPANLLELHCGGGTNTVALARCFDEIVAVELNRTLAD
eukprot:1047820-Amphidinium_carterae.1